MKAWPLMLATSMLYACGSSSTSSDETATVEQPEVPAVAADPAPLGSYETSSQEYDFGRITVSDEQTGSSYETDVHGYVVYPNGAEGPFPVILFQHGRHQTCETGIGQLPVLVGDDLCPDLAPIVTPANSYLGYDYLAQNLASHGYAVISIDTNDINDNDGSATAGDSGAYARATLILEHLDAFAQINASGGEDFDHLIGMLDMSRIGLMGHSRGGEGVGKTISLNASREQPHAIEAVFALAPTDYNTQPVEGVAYATLLPYCDGDVEDLMGAYAYDNARYADDTDVSPKFQIVAMGANHNYFNTIWTSDDWTIHGSSSDSHCGTSSDTHMRDSEEQQRALGVFYMASFFRYFIGLESEFAGYWTGLARVPSSACPEAAESCEERYHLSVHPAPEDRVLIDATPADLALSSNALDLPVTFDGFAEFGLCQPEARSGEGCAVAEPTFSTASQLYLSWNAAAVYRSALGGLDVSDYALFSLRAGLSLGDVANETGQDFLIVLIDGQGQEAVVHAADLGTALFDPPGDTFADGGSEKTTLNGVIAPLSLFAGIDLTNLAALELRFDQTQAGTVQITDLMFRKLYVAAD